MHACFIWFACLSWKWLHFEGQIWRPQLDVDTYSVNIIHMRHSHMFLYRISR